MYLSAARSLIFNTVLAERVTAGTWASGLVGDVFSLRDSGSVFLADIDTEITARLRDGDIHPSGPLFGKAGKLAAAGDTALLEERVYSDFSDMCTGLMKNNLAMERRALRVIPQDVKWQFADDGALSLAFSLPRGCFATALVRELINY